MKKVGLLFTSYVLVNYMNELFSEQLSRITFYNVVDDSILKLIGSHDEIVKERILQYYTNMEQLGVDLIVNTCTSVSPFVDELSKKIKTPILKMEAPMMIKIQEYKKVGLIATLPTALKSLEDTLLGIEKEVCSCTCNGAFEYLEKKQTSRHDNLIIGEILKMQDDVEVIVLAQASMNRAILEYDNVFQVPVLGLISCMIDELKGWEHND